MEQEQQPLHDVTVVSDNEHETTRIQLDDLELVFKHKNMKAPIEIKKSSYANLILSNIDNASNGKLDHSIIEAFMESFNHKKHETLVLANQASTVMDNGKLNMRSTFKLSKFKHVAGPVFLQSLKHWTLFFVNMATSTVCYLDPLHDSNSNDPNFDKIYLNWWLVIFFFFLLCSTSSE